MALLRAGMRQLQTAISILDSTTDSGLEFADVCEGRLEKEASARSKSYALPYGRATEPRRELVTHASARILQARLSTGFFRKPGVLKTKLNFPCAAT